MFRWKVTALVCRTLPHTWHRPIELTLLIGLAVAMPTSWKVLQSGPMGIRKGSESRYKTEEGGLPRTFSQNYRFVQPSIKHNGATDFLEPRGNGAKMKRGWWATKDLNL
jgi:hypothetical protein